MPRLYRKIPVTIEAIRFQYSQEGVKELKEFCGPALLNYGKDRHIKAVGWAHIGTLEDGGNDSPQVAHIANEGTTSSRALLANSTLARQTSFCKPTRKFDLRTSVKYSAKGA